MRSITGDSLRLAASTSARSAADKSWSVAGGSEAATCDEAFTVGVPQDTERHDTAPPRIPPTLAKAPRAKEIYWCRFPRDAELPEFWKVRPVVVLSRKADIKGAALVVPCTSIDQNRNPDAVELSARIGGSRNWAVCDKPSSVAVSRLTAVTGMPKVTQNELSAILRRVASITPVPTLSDSKRATILRMLELRHGAPMTEGADPKVILGDIIEWMSSLKDS
ncbi:type II toxin-antitoxin system PemK/MazF family toxin [Rhizobium leguminosarum]|uniref:type II toxin-antitoxin system PemK/MazF family toxin n=1 Tax=Rhizobium leguminosarum TaxID=384 RepID=UPI001C94B578|nr:type II toxin-antitoxin system PemK/MazF family toxin [Rhizobium leguminosarum]MBY5439057.1 type II toxin-antitoxin system PemK/MazF family toxin [Rhizobium leguminosarum]